MKYATVTEARSQLPQLLDSIERVALTRHGKPIAVLMDIQDYRNLVLAEAMIKDPERLAAVHRDSAGFRNTGEVEPARERAATVRTDEIILAEETAALDRMANAAEGLQDKRHAKKALDEALAEVLAALKIMEARVHHLEDTADHVAEMVETRAAEAG